MQRRHQRGVSGNWAADRLTAEEEAEYKAPCAASFEDARARARAGREGTRRMRAPCGEIERGGGGTWG